jgi:hypothetical protein
VCIKFSANLGESVTETLAMIRQMFGEESMSRNWVCEWLVQGTEKNGKTGKELSQEHAHNFL